MGDAPSGSRPLLRGYRGQRPRWEPSVFIAENAVLIGNVEIGADSSVWYSVVMRGDVGFIRIGARTNIQDQTLVHMTQGVSNTEIGDDVTIGHGVIVHGARVHDGALIGMGSILLDNVEVGAEALVAAGTLLTPGTRIPPRSLVRGHPGRVIRELNDQERIQGRLTAAHYVELSRQYRGE